MKSRKKKKPRTPKRKSTSRRSKKKSTPCSDFLEGHQLEEGQREQLIRNGQSDSLHNDAKETVVMVEGKVYCLVPSDLTFNQLINAHPSKRPHVRRLSPIPLRSSFQQEKHNKEVESIYDINKKHSTGRDSGKITSTKKAIKMGANVSEEVEKLLKLKEKTKDSKELSKIRKQLRKLDYKRYKE